MNIALIAHDAKKELMVQFCIAYCRVLSQHNLTATGTTGKLVADATGLPIQRCWSRRLSRGIRRRMRPPRSTIPWMQLVSRVCAISVSYTHLDVYKRQQYIRTPSRRPYPFPTQRWE